SHPRSHTLLDPVSMLYPSMDPNERFRARRDAVRRRKRRRRALVVAILLLAVLALAGGMTLAGKSERKAGTTHYTVDVADDAVVVAARPRPLPIAGTRGQVVAAR